MSDSIVLSDELLSDAEAAGQATARTPSEQIERWARLGRAVEPLLAGGLNSDEPARPVSECLESVGTAEGRQRLKEYLNRRPFPRFDPVDGSPGVYVRTDSDGTETKGRFENRQFVVVE